MLRGTTESVQSSVVLSLWTFLQLWVRLFALAWLYLKWYFLYWHCCDRPTKPKKPPPSPKKKIVLTFCSRFNNIYPECWRWRWWWHYPNTRHAIPFIQSFPSVELLIQPSYWRLIMFVFQQTNNNWWVWFKSSSSFLIFGTANRSSMGSVCLLTLLKVNLF